MCLEPEGVWNLEVLLPRGKWLIWGEVLPGGGLGLGVNYAHMDLDTKTHKSLSTLLLPLVGILKFKRD